MDYKAVLEEQVRELQKTQDKIACTGNYNDIAHKIALAEQILALTELLMKRNGDI